MFRFIFFYYRSHPSEQQQALTLGVQQEQEDNLATVEVEILGEETLSPNPQSLTLGVELEPMECPQAGPAPLLSIKVLPLKLIPGAVEARLLVVASTPTWLELVEEIPGQLSLSRLAPLQLQWIRFLQVLLLRPVEEQTCLQPTGPAVELQMAMEVLLEEQEAALPMWHLRSTSTYNLSCH